MKQTLLVTGRFLEIFAIAGAIFTWCPPTTRNVFIYLMVFAAIWMLGGTLIKLSGKNTSEIKTPMQNIFSKKISDLSKAKQNSVMLASTATSLIVMLCVMVFKRNIINYFGF